MESQQLQLIFQPALRKREKVLTIDIDPQGNTTSGLGVDKNSVENTLYELLLGEAETKDTIVKDVVENVDLIHLILIFPAQRLN